MRRKVKALLFSDNLERFSFFTGNADSNLLKSEIARRKNLHRIVKDYVAMHNASVVIKW